MATRIQGYRDVIINGPGHVQVFCKSYYPKCRACATVTVKTEGKILKALSKFKGLLTEALNILSPNLSSDYLCIPYANLHDEDEEAYYKQSLTTDDVGGNKDCQGSSTANCDNDNTEVIEVGDEFINKIINELIKADESCNLPAKNPFSASPSLSCNDALEETQMEMDLRNPPQAFEEFKGKIECPLIKGPKGENVGISDPNNRMDNQRLGQEHIVPGDTNPPSPNTTVIEADDAYCDDEGYKSSFTSTVTEVAVDTSLVSNFDLAVVSSATQYPTTTFNNKNHCLLPTAIDFENNHDQSSQPGPLLLDEETSSDSLGATGIRKKENTRLTANAKPDAVADTEYCRGNFSRSDADKEKNRQEGKRKIENTLFPTKSNNQPGASFSDGGGRLYDSTSSTSTSDFSNEYGGNQLNAPPENLAVNQEPVETSVAGTDNSDVLPDNEEFYEASTVTESTREEPSPLVLSEWTISSSQSINEKQSGSQNGRGKKADVYYTDSKQRHETFKKSGLANAIIYLFIDLFDRHIKRSRG